MSERKELLSVSYHSDDDTGLHRVGEIDFGVNARLEPYIERYGYKGVTEILSVLGHLAWEVKSCFYELNTKTARQNGVEAKQDNGAMLKCTCYSSSFCSEGNYYLVRNDCPVHKGTLQQ